MATSSGLFLATIYNQSQLAKRKHVARYWSIDTAATAVPLSPHPSAITKLAAAIFGGPLFGGGVLPAQYSPCGNENACISGHVTKTAATITFAVTKNPTQTSRLFHFHRTGIIAD